MRQAQSLPNSAMQKLSEFIYRDIASSVSPVIGQIVN